MPDRARREAIKHLARLHKARAERLFNPATHPSIKDMIARAAQDFGEALAWLEVHQDRTASEEGRWLSFVNAQVVAATWRLDVVDDALKTHGNAAPFILP